MGRSADGQRQVGFRIRKNRSEDGCAAATIWNQHDEMLNMRRGKSNVKMNEIME